MDPKSQIAEKIKEMQEKNLMRSELAEQAEKRMASEGYAGEPVAEQVMKPEKKPAKAQEPPENPGTTADIAETQYVGAPPEQEESLSDSFKNVEAMLGRKNMVMTSRETIMTPQENNAAPKPAAEEEPLPVSKMPSKLKGPHRKGKPRTRVVEAPVAAEDPKDEEYGLICPITGEVKTIIKTETIVGRSLSADIIIDNRNVSREHAKITKRDGKYYLMDIGSLNGTEINDVMIDRYAETPLKAGDTIKFARFPMIFETLK